MIKIYTKWVCFISDFSGGETPPLRNQIGVYIAKSQLIHKKKIPLLCKILSQKDFRLRKNPAPRSGITYYPLLGKAAVAARLVILAVIRFIEFLQHKCFFVFGNETVFKQQGNVIRIIQVGIRPIRAVR